MSDFIINLVHQFTTMKRLSFICLFLLLNHCLFAQKESADFKNKQLRSKYLAQTELKAKLEGYDFSRLFTHSDNSVIYGFIGNNYQRIRIKLIRVTKDSLSPDTYHIYGKSMVKNNIDEFVGIIKISNIKKFNPLRHGCEDEYKYKGYKGEFMLLGDYVFHESAKQNHAGTFKGSLESDFFVDKNNQIQYDDIEDCSDSYTNNQFVGQWAAYNGNIIKRCNWGDFRIPDSGDFDIGAGEFSPHGYDNKYLKNGWQNMDDQKAENAKWWE
jgi:hypothetical protein